MPNYIVKCPHCHTTRTASQNSQVRCSGCGKILHIDNNGNVKKTSG